VPEQDLVRRLQDHKTLGSAPREQLEWLAARATVHRFETGERVTGADERIRSLFILLSGHTAIRTDRGGVTRKLMEWRAGDVSGLLPYSRLDKPPGWVTAEEPTEIALVPEEHFPEMIARCPDVTAKLVHVMLDRARRFTKADLHDEKMLSLGRMAAGLAHELNNPASAVARSAQELRGSLAELEATSLALGAVGLTPEQLAVLAKVRARCEEVDARMQLTPLERADRREAVEDWLARRGLRREVADGLADTPLAVEVLDTLAGSLGDDALGFALQSLGAGHRVRMLSAELASAANRMHALVAAFKRYTRMDQSNVPEPVAIGEGLADTLRILGAKARGKSVSVSLTVPEDLPAVEGFGGELNQVWQNLIDNALDAAPASGHVQVSAACEGDRVVVRVVDDGPGVPEHISDQIFEPLFTTKPPGQGTGLGLDIARQLVDQHEGELEFDSRPGRTEFRVRLPKDRKPNPARGGT
jgi:signal transduction histidine kinase